MPMTFGSQKRLPSVGSMASLVVRRRAAAHGKNVIISQTLRTFRRDSSSHRPGLSSFAIAFDIDGVLLRGGVPIPGAPGALRRLYDDPAQPAKLRIPYIFLTNGGGTTEASRADELSKQLDVPVLPDQVLLGHSPFRNLADKFKTRRVLAVGKGEPDIVLKSYGFQHVIHMDAFVNEFDNIDGLGRFKPWSHQSSKKAADPLPGIAQIAGVFVVSDPIEWSRDMQVICDVLRSGGEPGREGVWGQPQPPLFFAADDLDYQSTFPIPRLGMGAFRVGLESIYNRLPGAPLEYVSYGKPQLTVYKNAERVLEGVLTKLSSISVEVSEVKKHPPLRTIYMIGDNPSTDILGAKFAGQPWFSILTRSGCYRGQPISSLYQADKVVDDVEEAVDFILRRETLD